MAAIKKTSLSAGEIIRKLLVDNPEVSKRANKVFPVVEDKAILPYIVYRRTNLQQAVIKGQHGGADTVGIEVICFTESYTSGVELAEAVRGALDGAQGEVDGMVMRSCVLVDSEEAWQDDAFLQQLVFNVKI